MAGYAWTPQYRINSGAAQNMRTLFSYAGGPVRVELDYLPEQQRRLDGNKAVRTLFWGFRPRITFHFDIGGGMTDAGQVQTLVNALVDSTKVVDVSLNTGSPIWRTVELVSIKGPDPFHDKTLAGARWVLTVEAESLIATYPDTGTGDAW